MDLDGAIQVWNRACAGTAGRGAGDQHLWALISVHSMIMSGGVGHARDVRPRQEFDRAVRACEYLGLSDLGELLRRIELEAGSPEAEGRLNREYFAGRPDEVIMAAFERKYAVDRDDFAPLAAVAGSQTTD